MGYYDWSTSRQSLVTDSWVVRILGILSMARVLRGTCIC